MKYHKLGGLSNRNVLFHSSGGWVSPVRLREGSIASEGREGASFPCLPPRFRQFAANLRHSLACGSFTPAEALRGVLPMCFSLCPNFISYKDTGHIGLGAHTNPV